MMQTLPRWRGAWFPGALSGVLLVVTSCGRGDKPAAGAGDRSTVRRCRRAKFAAGKVSTEGKSTIPPAKKPAPAIVVAQPINLKNFPIMEGADKLGVSPANVSYKMSGDVKSVYAFQRKHFIALGWKEIPEASSFTEQSSSGVFAGAGYWISASVYSGATPGLVDVMLHNHGSINLAKLPCLQRCSRFMSDR